MPDLSIDIYGGRDVTGRATSAVTGKRFLRITGNEDTGLLAVAHATPNGRVCGVAKYDADTGDLVGIARGSSRIVRVTAASTIAAFGEVQVGEDGKAAPLTEDGVSVGYVTTAVAAGADAHVSLLA